MYIFIIIANICIEKRMCIQKITLIIDTHNTQEMSPI